MANTLQLECCKAKTLSVPNEVRKCVLQNVFCTGVFMPCVWSSMLRMVDTFLFHRFRKVSTIKMQQVGVTWPIPVMPD